MIRPFAPADLDAVMALWLAANLDAHPFVPEAYWRDRVDMVRSALPAATLFVDADGDDVRGFAGIADGEYLAGLFVAKAWRSRGVGAALLEKCKENRTRLELNVYAANAGAVRFYLRNGFAVVDERVCSDTGETEYRMEWKT